MKLDDLRFEITEFAEDCKYKLREAWQYKGNQKNFEKNTKKAAVGALATLVAGAVSPVLGLAALGYTIVKGKQAYEDYQKRERGR